MPTASYNARRREWKNADFLQNLASLSVLEILRLPKEVTLLDLKSLLQEHSLGFLPFKHKQRLHHSIRYDENFHHVPHHTCCAPIKAP